MSEAVEPAPDAALTTDEAARAAVLERRLAELEATLNARLVRAELKAEAVRHGMVDLDGLKLVDPAAVTIDEAGEVRGAAALMRELKRAKPWLFGGASTSSAASPPPAQAPKLRMASEMSHDEWQAARASLLQRR
ncbi:MAG TPA: hypothetical protein VHS58_18755 [Acetobacteraceae bacterium]|jgi:stage V sporulation protein SpoVS|nr:hypothetical protein [Acetobacteraceae bacterium]